MNPGQEELDRRVLDHLETLRRARGTPLVALAEALGLGRAQVTRRFKGRVRFAAGELLTILETMGVAPGEFFAGLAGGFHAELYLARLEQQHPRQVKYARNDLLRHPPRKPYGRDQLRRVARGLQELRLTDAKAAWKQALRVLRTLEHTPVEADPRTECETRIALGAVSRARGHYGRAAFYLREALRCAGSDGSLRARTLQAVMSLAADQGDFEAAVEAVREAAAECARAGDLQGQGRAMVSKGILLVNHGHYREAIEAYRQSLSVVADDEWYVRFAAFQGLGLCHAYQEEIDEALGYVDQALAVDGSRELAPLQRAAVLWLRAEIHLEIGAWTAGLADLRSVFELYVDEKTGPLQLTLVALRLAWACQVAGRLRELGELTVSLVSLLGDVADSGKLLKGAVAELIGLATRGELSAEILKSAYREVLHDVRAAPHAAHLAVTRDPNGS